MRGTGDWPGDSYSNASTRVSLPTAPAPSPLEIDLIAGRRNQIRLHFAHAGFPLIGERKYARGKDASVRIASRRIALHAWKLAFDHPLTKQLIMIEDSLPDDLVEVRGRAASG